jgi:hypothetical protein
MSGSHHSRLSQQIQFWPCIRVHEQYNSAGSEVDQEISVRWVCLDKGDITYA